MGFSQRLAKRQPSSRCVWPSFSTIRRRPAPRRGWSRPCGMRALGGGKRLRPFLVIECAGLFGVSPARPRWAAAALECVHCYSLIHDDLPAMDDDDLRRGQPTVHKAFDEATAILAGDAPADACLRDAGARRAHADAQRAHRAGRRTGARRRMAAWSAASARPRGRQAGPPGGRHRDITPAGHEDRRAHPLCLRGRRHPRRRQRGRARALAEFGERDRPRLPARRRPARRRSRCRRRGQGDRQGRRQGDAGVDAWACRPPRTGWPAGGQAIAALDPFGPSADILREAARFVVRRQT